MALAPDVWGDLKKGNIIIYFRLLGSLWMTLYYLIKIKINLKSEWQGNKAVTCYLPNFVMFEITNMNLYDY